MSGFGDSFGQGDVDPAAEFLAREQNDLAGLEDEVKPAAITVPTINGATNIGVDEHNGSLGSFEMIDVDSMGQQADANSTAIRMALHSDSPSPPVIVGQNVSNGGSRNSVREEPEKIRKWREEQVKRLEEKDAEEERKKQELREIAKNELDEWYRNHEEVLAKTKAANRNAEKQFVAEDDDILPGTEWDRIAKLCDFNPKAKQGSKDVSRMRSIILQMKQNPIPVNCIRN